MDDIEFVTSSMKVVQSKPSQHTYHITHTSDLLLHCYIFDLDGIVDKVQPPLELYKDP